jgi:hypothetical protein
VIEVTSGSGLLVVVAEVWGRRKVEIVCVKEPTYEASIN